MTTSAGDPQGLQAVAWAPTLPYSRRGTIAIGVKV